MASEGKNQQGDGKGFAGLSSMVSDIDAEVASASKQTQTTASSLRSEQATQPVRHQQLKATQEDRRPASPPRSGSSLGKWLFGFVVLFVTLWVANQSIDPRSLKSDSSAGTSSAVVTPASAPAPAPAPVRQLPAAQPQIPSRPLIDKPPVGRSNVLSNAQIRYCLAEKIRLDASETVINNYVDSEVNRFNGFVTDYNSRCGEFRYRQGALDSAKRDIEPYRGQLQAEGRNRFVRSPSVTARQLVPSQTVQSAPPATDATVKAIQLRLSELGYNPGAADGLPGGKTRAAIMAFQRDVGLAADGIASQALLQKLLLVESRAPSAAQNQLSRPEQESLEAACSTDKYVNGPAAYRSCLDRQTTALLAGLRRPNLSALSSAETQSIEAACSTDKYVNGPAAYNKCLTNQLTSLLRQDRRPDLSRLSNSEKQSIEAACSTDKYVNGPAAYNSCLKKQLAALDRQVSRPDLSRLTASDRQSIEAACSTDKYINGPAAYNSCLSRQLVRLNN